MSEVSRDSERQIPDSLNLQSIENSQDTFSFETEFENIEPESATETLVPRLDGAVSLSDVSANVSTEDATASSVRIQRELSQRDLEEMPTVLDWEEVSSEASDAINNVVENIVDRMRVERMFELRRIQFGDRAVSSGETAQRLEQFLSGETSGDQRPHRSEIVRNELEELSRNQSVGNLLNTRFRTLLENSLSAPPQGYQVSGSGIRPMPTAASTTSVSSSVPPPPRGPPSVPPAPPLQQSEPEAPHHQRDDPARQTAERAAQEYEPPDFSNRQFDYAITDVEELFQRRLVSDVLHSTFRNVLELHIERRLVRAGVTPQRRAQQPSQQPLQQQTPQSPQTQAANPFASTQPTPYLSMPPISEHATSSRRLPEIERQIHSMSVEMKEMKGMIKLLVDTQLDIQRSIRQEVNALIKGSTVTPARPTPPLKDGMCVVCLEAPCDTVLYRCGHLCCCFNCARSLRVAGHHCPVCRAEVTDIMRVYRSTNE